ncbi:SMI1/KNR4 family protein [Arachnia propionica]|uniref:SMI1/KNR4 family protein n=1 Tax=Arachnia propionica TaxID=1750 RepID=A0A3P1WYS5_9ACTN|nr:SMI1/KNR4 family protein [Arachnia propionica]RRD50827.1 SMI1/KNR4 family protein [Arachnia propionica]
MVFLLDDVADPMERIRRKLAVARLVDHLLEVFGADGHEYRLGPPLSLERVRRLEDKRGFTLPDSYVRFVTEIGDGGLTKESPAETGAGPSHGLITLDRRRWDRKKSTRREALIGSLTAEQWQERGRDLDELDDDAVYKLMRATHDGVLEIGCGGCSDFYGLVVTGPARGSVISASWDHIPLDQCPRIVADDFLTWYETWLDDVLNGGVRRSWQDHGLTAGEMFRRLRQGVDRGIAGVTSNLHLRMMGDLPRLKPKRLATLREYHETTDDARLRDYCLALLAQFDPDATRPLLDNATDPLLIHILATRAPSLIPSFTDRLNRMRTKGQDLADAVDLIRSVQPS